MSQSGRADPFAGDLDVSGFTPSPVKPKAKPEAIRQVSEANNFPSRAPNVARSAVKLKQPRRRRTGRNVQFNIKATPKTIERFIAICDQQKWVFGETLEHALNALEQSLGTKR